MTNARDDYDSPWKEALERWFPEFLALLFPAVHAGIDWERGYEFLDKELQQVVRDAELGRRHVDKLAKVHVRDGGETWLLIHSEVQSEPEDDFDRRMYVYNYRLFDRYKVEVVSLAVLADDSPNFRADEFHRARWGFDLTFRFPTVKLRDVAGDWQALESNPNPFALVVMAHLKAQESRDGDRRLRWKLYLVRLLVRRGYNRGEVLELLRVIDWLVRLPAELEVQFNNEMVVITEEQKMPYVTSFERIGMRKGVRKGEALMVRKALAKMEPAQAAALFDIPVEEIMRLAELPTDDPQMDMDDDDL